MCRIGCVRSPPQAWVVERASSRVRARVRVRGVGRRQDQRQLGNRVRVMNFGSD